MNNWVKIDSKFITAYPKVPRERSDHLLLGLAREMPAIKLEPRDTGTKYTCWVWQDAFQRVRATIWFGGRSFSSLLAVWGFGRRNSVNWMIIRLYFSVKHGHFLECDTTIKSTIFYWHMYGSYKRKGAWKWGGIISPTYQGQQIQMQMQTMTLTLAFLCWLGCHNIHLSYSIPVLMFCMENNNDKLNLNCYFYAG